MLTTSEAGLDLIRRNEGCRLVAYQDVVGVWTIGWGSTAGVKPGDHCTQAEADEMLAHRLRFEFEPGVHRAIEGAATTQAQFDAMVCLAWNIGIGAFQKSSVARHHKAGEHSHAARAFHLWNRAGGNVLRGLVRRRGEESDLYSGM